MFPGDWTDPDLRLGFEVVASSLLDVRVEVIAVEDIIADRMGQFASGTAPEMWTQARDLFLLHRDADRAYLDRRIREETAGDYGVEQLEAAADQL